MPGQALIEIAERQWQVSLALYPWEISAGLGGVSHIPPGTGMFFDKGYEDFITVTTEPMLFPIDIVWIADTLIVVDIALNVSPGLRMASGTPVCYWLEVNAGEAEGIHIDDRVDLDLLPEIYAPQEQTILLANFGAAVGLMFLAVALVQSMMNASFGKSKALSLVREHQAATVPLKFSRVETPEELEFFADSADHIACSLEQNDLHPQLESVFREAIRRAATRAAEQAVDRYMGKG